MNTQASNGQATIRTTVRQVLLDVVVTGAKNHPVNGLQEQDFSIFEDGQQQKIAFFEAHTAPSDSLRSNASELPPLPANTFRNSHLATNDLPLNVLLYDLLNTPIESQPFAHEEIVKFLRDRPTGSRFAIFVLADTLHLVQGFTDDDRQLIAAMSRKDTWPSSSPLYRSSETPNDTLERLSQGALFTNDSAGQTILGRMGQMEAFSRGYFLGRRIEKTIAAFEEIAKFLGGLPGRKNLIWLSGSFPANIFPGNDPLDPFGTSMNYGSELHQAADLLTVGQVAVYPVNIRGLVVDPTFTAANSFSYRTSAGLSQAHLLFMMRLAAEHTAMDLIAEDTGGHAFYNTNGLSQAIASSTVDGSNYYALSYSPSNTKFDGRLRKIRVRVAQGGYHLAYRRSYLADDNLVAEGAANAPMERLQVALRRGAPLAQELLLETHLTQIGSARVPSKEEIGQLAPFPAFASQKKWDTVKVQRYLVDFAIQGSRLSFEPSADGTKHARLEFLFGAYDTESRTMFGDRVPVEKKFSLEKASDIQKGAYHVRQLLEIPTGAAWLRLAVHDAIGDRLGSIEIPLPLTAEEPKKSKPTP